MIPAPLVPLLATATRLGVLDAVVAVVRALVEGRRLEAARAAYRGAKAAAARRAIEAMR